MGTTSMDDSLFAGWDNFYLMIGSASGALIGLLFVVVTLTAGYEREKALRGASLYMTPTVIHFTVVLTMSAAAMVPRLGVGGAAAIFGLSALVGLGKEVHSCLGMRNPMPGTEPAHWSDFWMYGVLPGVIYFALFAASVALFAGANWATYAMAALLMILLLVGIRNAWDLITWLAPRRKDDADQTSAHQ
jgi:hypothetical protein